MAVLVVVHGQWPMAIPQDLDLDDKYSVRICMLFNGSYSAVHSTVEIGTV